jgi:hypothetical protein
VPPAKKKPAAKQKPTPAKTYGQRADLGKSIDPWFGKQPAPLRPILDQLRALVAEAAPDATATIKWGMPVFTLDGEMMCALRAHRAHVNLVLAGPPASFADPHGLLEGEGKTGRHLKLTSAAPVPKDQVRGWLKTAAANVRGR